jgi:hypothetical protein
MEAMLTPMRCFQERVLAVRTVHFASDQLFWECAHSFEEERGIIPNNDQETYKEYSLNTLSNDRDAWQLMVTEYTSRNLTYQSDTLPALSGVISAMQKLTGDISYAGIWRSWFLLGLLWRVQIPNQDVYVFAPKEPQRLDFWRAPSWSWASLEGVALSNFTDEFTRSCEEYIAHFEDCAVIPSGINPLGELKSGYAKIRGPLTTLTTIDQEVLGHLCNGRACTIQLTRQRRVYSGVFFDHEMYDTCDVIMITSHLGLAIRPTKSTQGTYVRVGQLSIYERMYDVANDANMVVSKGLERTLTASDYPEPTSITLL